MVNKKLKNVGKGTASSDVITKHQIDTAMIDKHDNNQNIDLKNTYNVINSKQQTFNEMNASRNSLVCYEDVRDVFASRKESVFLMQTHLDMEHNYIYNAKTPIKNGQGANKSYVDQHVAEAGDTMSGELNMGDNDIKGLPTRSQAGDEATSKAYVDDNFFKLSGGSLTSNLNVLSPAFVHNEIVLNFVNMQYFFVENRNPYVNNRFNMVSHKIINLGDPSDNKDAVNKQLLKQEVQKSHIKPNHYNNELKYLMANKLERSDLLGDGFSISKIDNLYPDEGNYHQYNHKVLFTTIRKNQKGGYTYEIEIQCCPLDKDKDYTFFY